MAARRSVLASALVIALLADQPASAQQSIFRQLVGVWNHLESGHSIDVRRDGDVWSTGSPLMRTSGTIQAGGNFAFEGRGPDGRTWRCVFYITFLGQGNRANWRYVTSRGEVNCPDGVYERVSRGQG